MSVYRPLDKCIIAKDKQNKKKRDKLSRLLKEYDKEIDKGDLTRIEDSIAIYVIMKVTKYYSMSSYDINAINLSTLICNIVEYQVPSLAKLKEIREQNENYFRNNSVVPTKMIKENTAIKWLDYMIKTGKIHEGDIIDLSKFKIVDFIHDPRIIEILDLRKGETVNHVGKKTLTRKHTNI